MTIDRVLHATAGSLVLLGLALAHWHHPLWSLLPAFVGLNLLQSAFSDWCLLARLLDRAGMSEGHACGLSRRPS